MTSPISSDGLRTVVKQGVRLGATATSRWRRGPDLVIVGVKRGGTTSLFRDIERHPAMCPLVPSARRLPLRENQKGVHFFDTGFHHGERWYRGHFPTETTRRRRARRVGKAFTAEASPYYFFQPLAARRVAAALPEAQFVVLLRDPVERTVSHWSEQTRNGVETLTLAEAVDAEESRVGDAGARLADGSISTSHAHEQKSYVAQSMYAASIQRWFDAVGRDRLVVAFSEDYY
ncbi:MAG: sulfotransferase, partial [Ilumatobacter sp.]